MNLYTVKFPAMSRPSFSSSGQTEEDPQTMFGENLEDLRRFSELWPMGRGLMGVVDVMRKLYDRVVSDEVRRTTHSRESYAALEKTINFAQDDEIQVAELAAEALPREGENVSQAPQNHPDGRTSNVFEHGFGGISDVQMMSPGSLSAVLDEDVWRDFVFFQGM